MACITSRLQKKDQVSLKGVLSRYTDTHDVRGTGRDDQVPARAVADIEEEADDWLQISGLTRQRGARHPSFGFTNRFVIFSSNSQKKFHPGNHKTQLYNPGSLT